MSSFFIFSEIKIIKLIQSNNRLNFNHRNVLTIDLGPLNRLFEKDTGKTFNSLARMKLIRPATAHLLLQHYKVCHDDDIFAFCYD